MTQLKSNRFEINTKLKTGIERVHLFLLNYKTRPGLHRPNLFKSDFLFGFRSGYNNRR